MKFQRGDVVRKKSGSAWEGTVCGEYSTTLTPEGYAVESLAHPGSVQIYPAHALEQISVDTEPVKKDAGLHPSFLDSTRNVFNWPANSSNLLAPWYLILWRLFASLFIYPGLAIAFFGVLLAQGPRSAKSWWKSI